MSDVKITPGGSTLLRDPVAVKLEQVVTARGKTYGPYKDLAVVAQCLKSVMHNSVGWSELEDFQRESLDMIATKIARVLVGDPDVFDTWHDIEGYAHIVARELNHE